MGLLILGFRGQAIRTQMEGMPKALQVVNTQT